MNYIVFKNAGEIDPRAISTFGISAKENENPIGFFGTGLKYAIAILLRERHDVVIYSGLNRYEFTEKMVPVRGQEFGVVAMNGVELSFTTRVGVNWKMWQAFREIYCNCLDEGGEVFTSNILPVPEAGFTYVVVRGTDFEAEYYNRQQIVLSLPEDKLIYGNGRVDVYDKPSESIFYRGIRVEDFSMGKNAMFTYNILTPMTLTEDRTLRFSGSAHNEISRVVVGIKDKKQVTRLLLCEDDRGVWEQNLHYSSAIDFHEASAEFLEVLEAEYNANNDRLSKSAIAALMSLKSKRHFKNRTPEPLSVVEEKQFKRATDVCRRIFPDFDNYWIVVVKTLGQHTMALADMEEQTIVLSKECFEKGTKYLVSTLVEEYVHLKTGYGDMTRPLQTYLFDKICTMAEQHVLGEPI